MTGGDYAVTAARRAVASPGRRGLRCRAGAAARGCARRCWTAGASRPRFGRRRQPPPWPHWAAAPTSCSAQDNPDERTPIARSTPARRSSSARASARMSLSTHWAEGRRSSPAFARRARWTWPDCGGLDVVKFFPAEAAGGAAYIKALAAPYQLVRFIPTGGIDAAKLEAYVPLPQVLAVAAAGWRLATSSRRRSRGDREADRRGGRSFSPLPAAVVTVLG